ncbi:protein scarlet-like [Schistocerca serialis cubense]|uniref:protein scarlet-like n=1 Tax=Schistocerca serialis cubense TaxID=2023355 RepID=UPI00214EED10|nr:protein scarlet-like [Schistocerca serialis cubense]
MNFNLRRNSKIIIYNPTTRYKMVQCATISMRHRHFKKTSFTLLIRVRMLTENDHHSGKLLEEETINPFGERHNKTRDITGKAEGGHLIALMGASGGGKTTLLAAIGNRLKGQISGEVYLNGHLVTRSLMMKVSGFVPQNNIAFNTLTVNEHLLFMARMRMDSKISASSRKTWINSLVSELGLSTCADTVLSKISGGELKRLMLAIELLTDPPILLCDEPTTGLDSYNAQLMIQKLKSLAARGKIVICSVHQPSSEVFRFFDHLILLAEGRVAFQGTLSEAAEFFKRLGYMCPDSFNPADFYIKQLSVITDYEEECLKNIRKICTAFLQSDYSKALEKKPDTAPAELPMELSNYTKISHCNWLSQFYWLIWRSMKDSRRSYFGHALQIIMFLTTTTVVATFYQGVSPETQEGMQDFRGLLYLLSSEMFFYSAYSVLYTFPYEIPIFLRESNLYSSSAYYISKVIAAMPRTVIETAVFFGFIFILADFPVGGLVGYFMLLGPLLLISIGALAYGCMMSALFESYDLIATLTVAIDLLSMLMAGIFYNLRIQFHLLHHTAENVRGDNVKMLPVYKCESGELKNYNLDVLELCLSEIFNGKIIFLDVLQLNRHVMRCDLTNLRHLQTDTMESKITLFQVFIWWLCGVSTLAFFAQKCFWYHEALSLNLQLTVFDNSMSVRTCIYIRTKKSAFVYEAYTDKQVVFFSTLLLFSECSTLILKQSKVLTYLTSTKSSSITNDCKYAVCKCLAHMSDYFFRALPKRIAWLKYLSQFYYCNELLASLFWKHVDHISCPSNPDLPCLHNGEEVLDQYGFNPHNTMTDIIILFAFFVLLSMIGFIQIWRRSRKYSIY